MTNEPDARELQEAKQWLADYHNQMKIPHYEYFYNRGTLRVPWNPEHFTNNDARKLLDYHADRIKGVSHE